MDYQQFPASLRSSRRGDSRVEPLRYTLSLADPDGHLISVSIQIENPNPAGERLALPAWIPGSYLIRDFVRHVVELSATADDRSITATKLDLHTWRVVPPAGCRTLRVSYQVYAWDQSVRGAHFDRQHAFLNGTALFLLRLGHDHAPCELLLEPPPLKAMKGWQIATTLPAAKGTPENGFGKRLARDYFDLIDHPIECGPFESIEFKAGKPARRHRVAISGRRGGDLARLRADLACLCRWHLNFWGDSPPFREYLFQLQLTSDGYGGLEHSDSTALIARRDELPAAGKEAPDDGYQRLLGLFSHEYFHAWLVKRIRPQGHQRPDLQQPAATELLWLFEGFTAYYDDLALVRSGLITPARYLSALSKTIARVLATPGRFRQSLAEAARDAWIKLYRPDENSDNATISYYAKGSLLALALDLRIRRDSDGARSLDDVMRLIWRRFGQTNTALGESDFLACLSEIGGTALGRFARRAIHGTDDLPLPTLLADFGIQWQEEAVTDCTLLGLTLASKETPPRISRVANGSAAEAAGLAGGDQLVAFAGIRADPSVIERQLLLHRPGDSITLHVFRDALMLELSLVVPRPDHRLKALAIVKRTRKAAGQRRAGWLGSATE